MKKIILNTLLITGFAILITSCSSNDDLTADTQAKVNSTVSKESKKSKSYTVRYGLLSKTGVKILSGSYDVGSFVATNTVTGESYETYYGSGFQSLPQYNQDIPEGTYTFTAMQGQGGWVGYGSVSAVVSDNQVDADGYVTVYIPIAWEE